MHWDFDTILWAKFNNTTNAGNVDWSLETTSHIVLKSRTEGNFKWKTLIVKPIHELEDFEINYPDYFIASGQPVEYAIVPVFYGCEGTYSITSVTSKFSKMFIIEDEIVWGTEITDGYCDTTRNIPSSNVELLDRKYPIFIRNTIANYDTGMVIDSELHKLELKNQSQDELFATKEALNKAMAQSNQYTDVKLAQLIGDAPETLDTLKEVADAIEQNKIIVEALDVAIGNKVNQTDILKSIESVNENTIEEKVVDALVIKEVFQSVSNGKQLVASAITDKGINTEATDAFEIMAENIKNISSNKTDNDTLICNFYFNMNINLRAAEFKFYFPVKKSKKLIIKSLCLVGSKVREASNRNVYFQFYGKRQIIRLVRL